VTDGDGGSQEFSVEESDRNSSDHLHLNDSNSSDIEDLQVDDCDSEQVTEACSQSDVLGDDDDYNDDDDDDEKEWLDALESGDLDENGELKHDKDTSVLTARQRALLYGRQQGDVTALPIFSKHHTTALSDEQLNRRQLRAKKRRERALEKAEKDKKETLDRLLKKQDSKAKLQSNSSCRDGSQMSPAYVYSNKLSLITISVPVGFEFPLSQQVASSPVNRIKLCGLEGCNNPRKYSCSRTGISLCSLECYQKNMKMHACLHS
jgi:INO80 complex subunit B